MARAVLHVGLLRGESDGHVGAHALRSGDGPAVDALCGQPAASMEHLLALEWTEDLPGVTCCPVCTERAGLQESVTERRREEALRDASANAARAAAALGQTSAELRRRAAELGRERGSTT